MMPNKALIKDPATANCRVYVGNLEKEIGREEIEEKFKCYGKILGISLQGYFGFIQFENEESALEAISKEHGVIYKGKKLNVRTAVVGEGGKGNNAKNPLGDDVTPSGTTSGSVNANRGSRNRGRGGGGIGSSVNFRDRSPLNRDFYSSSRDNIYTSTNSRDSYTSPGNVASAQSERNDCEIIVVSKPLTEYAEFIELKLKNLGLTVDLLFPNEDVPIGRVLANVSSRGCLYAILVTPQNQEHHSLTLNILHGLPQEHRNMAVDDAIALISRNFEEYMRNNKTIPSTIAIGSITDRHPEAVQILINLLAENRQLTVLQYDRVIKYLQERRELQLKHELGDATDIEASGSSDTKQVELQNRILSILNTKKPASTPSPSSGTPISSILPGMSTIPSKPIIPSPTGITSTSSTPLLSDPSIQKALDSLLQGNLLKNIVKPANEKGNDEYGTNYSSPLRKF